MGCDVMQHELERARSALFALDAGCARSEWVRAMTAAKAADVDFDTVDLWSSTAPNYKNTSDVQAVWRSLREGGGISVNTLFYLAREAGWRDGQEAPALADVSKAKQSRPVQQKTTRKPAMDPTEVWGRFQPASAEHGYIMRKNGLPEGLRVPPSEAPRLTIAGQDVAGYLVVPCHSLDNKLQSLQFIPPGPGKKLNLPGCTMSGGLHIVGDLQADGLTYVCEGISAAWAAWKATGRPAVVCFGWGNVVKVAPALVERYPALELVLLPDVGKESDAQKIATSIPHCGWVALPEAMEQNSDVGDYAEAQGTDMLEELLADGVQYPAPTKPEQVERTNPAGYYFCDARDGTDTTHPLTEQGNALRLMDLHREALRFIPETKCWLVWRDGAWTISADGGLVRSLAANLDKQIYREGGGNLQEAVHFAKWARKSQARQTIVAAVSLLSDMPSMRVPVADINANPWLIGLDSGRQVLDLKTGATHPSQPGDLITKALGVTTLGQPDKAERWQDFLLQVFQGDRELIDWLQRWCGYLLTGSTSEHILLFGFGHGANGKSVFADLLRFIMGDYAVPIQTETLTESKRTAGSASPDLAALVGARMAMATETEDGCALAESLVKSLVAGDALSVRHLYGTPFTFLPSFKLLMLGNHKPIIRGTDLGIWRRIRLVPFTRTFTPGERDPELINKLKTEAPHILAWMVQGCIEWQRRRLSDVPTIVAKQTEEYREEMDTLGQWLGDCCIVKPNVEAKCGELYENYRTWATENGLRPCANRALGRRLSERGFGERKGTGGARYRVGLALMESTPSHRYP